MCGIAGIWNFGGGALGDRAVAMATALAHRGPDDHGVWTDPNAGIALGFRRLSIIDLSPAGAQPMISASGRYVIIFNGEVYNFRRLLEELGPIPLRGHSDTEVLLACIERWGLERAVTKFIGMFAFALWDRVERRLSLVRDRLGVKPLYYEHTAKGVTFASELKALGRGEIDRDALALYVRYGYVPAPYSIYRGVRKLMPGTILSIGADGSTDETIYWDSAKVAESAKPFEGSEQDAIEAVRALLADAVRLRMIADVPLGVFLSGGIDSPLVTALMQREAGDVKTFTIGFEGLPSEAPQAKAIARHLGTRHTESIISGRDVLDAIPLMASIYDEPFGDSSAIPTYLVSRMARQHVTVALSGDGGDELFGGYHRYFLGRKLDARVARVPRPLRRPLGRGLQAISNLARKQNLRDRMRGLGQALTLDDPIARFQKDVGTDLLRVREASELPILLTDHGRWPRLDDPTKLAMYLDAVSYLPDDILTKVDRASMAVSLEAREPLLDHRLVELAWSLPLSLKLRNGQGKWILRRLLADYLPESLIDQRKQGFGLPIDDWLRGPLHDWADALVHAPQDWFEPRSIENVWNDGPVAGAEQSLWRLLMFQQWSAAQ